MRQKGLPVLPARAVLVPVLERQERQTAKEVCGEGHNRRMGFPALPQARGKGLQGLALGVVDDPGIASRRQRHRREGRRGAIAAKSCPPRSGTEQTFRPGRGTCCTAAAHPPGTKRVKTASGCCALVGLAAGCIVG